MRFTLTQDSDTLWAISYGRNFELARQWINSVDFVDKLELNYYMRHEANRFIRKYFLEHKQYKYLILSTDDILGTACNVKQILQDEKKHHFRVISGWSNIKLNKSWAAVSLRPHDGIENKTSTYESYHFIEMADILTGRLGYPFFKAWFVGLPLTLMTREVVEKVSFGGFMLQKDRLCITPETKEYGRPIMFDLQFAIDCARHRIPIMIDTRVFLLHFGFGVINSLNSAQMENFAKRGITIEDDHLLVGKEKPYTRIYPYTRVYRQ
jgi:hypothetical protein